MNKRTEKLPIKAIQFGTGNFLRAFVDWMIHHANSSHDFNFGIAMFQNLPNDFVAPLKDQNGLYNVFLTGLKNGEAKMDHSLIECIRKIVNPYEEFDEVISLAESEDLEFIISNTTEAGIAYQQEVLSWDKCATSFPGKVTQLLYHRYQKFAGDPSKGLIFLPCELIDKNGEKLKEIISRYVSDWKLGEGFAQWLEESCYFCNTLVDRIVPGYPKDKLEEIHHILGYEDKMVTEGEHFHLWVIQGDEEVAKRFPLDKMGLNVIFTQDLTKYRTRKVRILNGAHTSMVPVAYLYGMTTVMESVNDEVIGKFIQRLIFDEIIPTLHMDTKELTQFAEDVMERFKNPYVKHFLSSIALNSFSKFKTRVLPSLLGYYELKNSIPQHIAFSFAAMLAYYKGQVKGRETVINDNQEVINKVQGLWSRVDNHEIDTADLVTTLLGDKVLWNQDLTLIPELSEVVTQHVKDICSSGMGSSITNFFKSTSRPTAEPVL